MNTAIRQKRTWLFAAIMLLAVSINGQAEVFDSTKKKEVNKTFSVSASDQLRLDNRYGSITVTHWNKPEVTVRVVVEAKAGNDKRAEELLDRVQISLDKAGNTVSGITSLSNTSRSGNDTKLTIDYYVSMPSALAISISQKYGNIILPERNEGKAVLEVKYGNLKAGSFTSTLRIEAGYSNLVLEDVQDAGMELAYCGNVSINNAATLNIDNKYSNMKIRNAGTMQLDNKYGNVSIQSVDAIRMDIKYSEIAIGRVKDEILAGSLDYSTLKVNELTSTFKRAEVSARYGNFNVGISPNASFKVAAENMKYGKADIKGLNITNTSTENKVNHYYQINGGTTPTIRFNGNSYSNIRINAL